jgi:hypothetical protein
MIQHMAPFYSLMVLNTHTYHLQGDWDASQVRKNQAAQHGREADPETLIVLVLTLQHSHLLSHGP